MSKEIIMTDFLKELKLITESTHNKEVRDAVNILTDYSLRQQGWKDEDFELIKMNKEEVVISVYNMIYKQNTTDKEECFSLAEEITEFIETLIEFKNKNTDE